MSITYHLFKISIKTNTLFFILSLYSFVGFSQNIKYSAKITEFYASDCGDDSGVNSIEEHTWKGWISDDVDLNKTYSGCVSRNSNSPYTFVRDYAQRNKNDVASSSISFQIDAWEDDGGNRCIFNSSFDDCRANQTCTFQFTKPLEDSLQIDTPTCGTSDYYLKSYFQYEYVTVSIAQATEYVNTFFSTGGDKPFWGSKGSWAYSGLDCAASGTIGHNQSSSFTTTAFCQIQVKFWWRVSSESGKDYLKVYLNDTLRDSISGNTPWAQKVLDLNFGNNKIEWVYSKNDSISIGEDRGFVDRIVFIEADSIDPGELSGNQSICFGEIPAKILNIQEAATFFDRTAYQWQSSNDLSSWTDILNADSLDHSPSALFDTTYYRRKVEDGCGTIEYSDTVTIFVNNPSNGIDEVIACDSYVWIDGLTYTASNNTATFNLINSEGCDSIITLNLTIGTQTSETFIKDTCERYFWRGNLYTNSGVYKDTIPNFAGCDSILTLNLTIRNQSSEVLTRDVCDSLVLFGITYKTSGTYFDTISNAVGCDSLVTLNLIVQNSSSASFSADVCDSYFWQGNTYSSSGIYTEVVSNAAGCDSVLTLDLTIRDQTSELFTFDVCDSLIWQGKSYNSSGTYSDTVLNNAGCDSIMTLNLTVRNKTSEIFNFDVCDSIVWQGLTIKNSGTYYDTIVNVAGCDSMMTLNLMIRNSSSSIQNITICDSYLWPQTNQNYDSTGIYYDTILNSSGCDSVIALDLNIIQSTGTTRNITSCNTYTWPQTNQTYDASGIYNDSLTNAVGCDSIISLNLTIDSLDISVTNTGDSLYSNQPNALSYQWLSCNGGGFSLILGAVSKGYKPTQNGSYAVEVANGICYDISACEFVSTTDIIERKNESTLSIYPNPANDKLHIKLNNFLANKTLQILKLDGSVVKEIQILNKLTELDISELATGIYIVRYNSSYKKMVVGR